MRIADCCPLIADHCPQNKKPEPLDSGLLSYSQQRSETVACAPESMQGLLQTPADYTHVVVAVTKDVITRREAVLSAFLLHLVQLLHVKLVVPHGSPIMRG